MSGYSKTRQVSSGSWLIWWGVYSPACGGILPHNRGRAFAWLPDRASGADRGHDPGIVANSTSPAARSGAGRSSSTPRQ
jgi:hypothetical protein